MRLIAGLAGGEVGFAFREARARPERAAGEPVATSVVCASIASWIAS
jgi:hypothetical protein